MDTKIRYMRKEDKNDVLEMMRIFYASDAVFTNGSEEIFNADFDNCVNDNPYIEGFIFEKDNNIQGYAMIAKSFSTEFGKSCIWIEDLYIKKEHRGLGIGSFFFTFLEEKYSKSLFRLEVEEYNKRAVHVYKKNGYEVLPYMEMKKNG